MANRQLYIDVQFDGIKRSVQIVKTMPVSERYEQVIKLPLTIANGVFYGATVYVDGIDMDEDEAKLLVVEILESPIWRAKVLGTVHPMKHDSYWNIIFLVDTIHEPHYTVLNAKYENGSLEIQIGVNGQPAFLGLNKSEYPLKATKTIYKTLDITFSEMKASNPDMSRVYIGMKGNVELNVDTVAHSIASYLRSLQH